MDSTKPLASKVSRVLDLPPSCVQFCPAYPQYFVVGTYNLERGDDTARPVSDDDAVQDEQLEAKKPQSRNGSLVLFNTDGENMFVNNTLAMLLLVWTSRMYILTNAEPKSRPFPSHRPSWICDSTLRKIGKISWL